MPVRVAPTQRLSRPRFALPTWRSGRAGKGGYPYGTNPAARIPAAANSLYGCRVEPGALSNPMCGTRGCGHGDITGSSVGTAC